MIVLKCPACHSDVEIDDFKTEFDDKTVVFCSSKDCPYHKSPLIGIDRKEPGVYLSESLV